MDMIALHHRRVRGEVLTNDESLLLERFLAERDSTERTLFDLSVVRDAQDQVAHEERQKMRESLLAREEVLLLRLRNLLAEIQLEQHEIHREWQRLVA